MASGAGPSSPFVPGGTGPLSPFVCGGLGPSFAMGGAGQSLFFVGGGAGGGGVPLSHHLCLTLSSITVACLIVATSGTTMWPLLLMWTEEGGDNAYHPHHLDDVARGAGIWVVVLGDMVMALGPGSSLLGCCGLSRTVMWWRVSVSSY